jgi:CRISPR-associated endonuclease/helicase Cas3
VIQSVTTLVDTLGDRLLGQFGLNCTLNHLKTTAQLAAYLHDWGKANHHFQGMVRYSILGTSPRRNVQQYPQMLRHEVVSVFLAWEFKDWLIHAPGDLYTALVAAGGHHLKLGGSGGKESEDFGEIRQSGELEMHIYCYHRHFKGILKYGRDCFGLPKKLTLKQPPTQILTPQIIKGKQQEIQNYFGEEWQGNLVLAAVIKALVIAGDASGSALAKENVNIQQWITQEITKTLDETKLNRVITHRLKGHSLRPFQEQLAAVTTRVAIARAGCGTGKTLGAYNWAKTHALGRKLFFCYPTTGTSTEGFIDYVHTQLESELFHSRAQFDLERLMTTGEENELEESSEVSLKLDSFRAWGAEVIVCTVDTVLGLFQCNRRPLYCFPAIANAAFIFDEIHCYDPRLFKTLLRFLQVVKSPILLMSASILPWQKNAIETAVGEPVKIVEGPKELEQQFRYHFHVVKEPDWKRIEEELTAGGKVLWVCNQVKTAIDIYREAKRRQLPALLYHSRYRYKDRVEHHRAVVDQFKGDRPILAITTQVAEMSLDLSATLLVSQIADPAGLIQRLGRLNRQYCGRALDAYFYPDDKVGFPYSKEKLEDGLTMLKHFTSEVCQADLAQWLELFTPESHEDPESLDLIWLDKSWQTFPIALREGSHNITAVLEQDLPQIKQLTAKEIPGYTLPIPSSANDRKNPDKDSRKWKKYQFFPIAPTKIWGYSEELGAYDVTQEFGS